MGGGCVPVCGRRCRCGCVSAWVSCCSECFCRLHVDTCRCIVPHDSTNVSIRQHTSRLHVDTCRCIVPHDSTNVSIRQHTSRLHVDTCRCIVAHDSRKQYWHCTKLHSQNSTESVCLCVAPCVSVWPPVCLCVCMWPLCVCVWPNLNRRHTCDVAFDTKQHLHFYICEWHKTAACAAPRV